MVRRERRHAKEEAHAQAHRHRPADTADVNRECGAEAEVKQSQQTAQHEALQHARRLHPSHRLVAALDACTSPPLNGRRAGSQRVRRIIDGTQRWPMTHLGRRRGVRCALLRGRSRRRRGRRWCRFACRDKLNVLLHDCSFLRVDAGASRLGGYTRIPRELDLRPARRNSRHPRPRCDGVESGQEDGTRKCGEHEEAKRPNQQCVHESGHADDEAPPGKPGEAWPPAAHHKVVQQRVGSCEAREDGEG